MNILIMGPAGAGKGTMSELIVNDFDIPHISTGDMLRDNIKRQTEVGMKAQDFMTGGQLVPDDIINEMIEQRLQEPDCQKGYLLDGYPRTLVQAVKFEELAAKIGKPLEMVVALEVDFDILAERITGRRVCPTCKSIYHIKNHPSKVEGICDVCGSELTQRKDDTVEQLKVRMQEYDQKTKPVIDYYQSQGKVEHVDASKNAETTYENVKNALKKVA